MFLEKCFIDYLHEPSLQLGVFALLQAYAFLQYLRDRLTKQEFQTLFFLGVSLAAGAVFLSVIYLTYTGRCHHLLDVNIVSVIAQGKFFCKFCTCSIYPSRSAIVSLETV